MIVMYEEVETACVELVTAAATGGEKGTSPVTNDEATSSRKLTAATIGGVGMVSVE